MKGRFVECYRNVLAAITGRDSSAHGFSQRMILAAEAHLGLTLPEALRDYYLSVGRHELNRVHNRLWPPDELQVFSGRLVFLEENQGVVYWGVRARTKSSDPMIVQTMDLDDDAWSVYTRCSLFLPAMLCWYAVGGWMPCTGYTDNMPIHSARRLIRGWALAGRSQVHSAYIRPGQVITIEPVDDGAMVRFGTRRKRDFNTLTTAMGGKIHTN